MSRSSQEYHELWQQTMQEWNLNEIVEDEDLTNKSCVIFESGGTAPMDEGMLPFPDFGDTICYYRYYRLFPDWKKTQRAIVEKICREHEKTLVWVAEAHGIMTGFIAYTLDSQENGQENTGEVELLAVHPDYQNHGIGTELNQFALGKMKASGMKLALVATGGDPGHAPARKTYEKAGYTALPGVRYYQDLWK